MRNPSSGSLGAAPMSGPGMSGEQVTTASVPFVQPANFPSVPARPLLLARHCPTCKRGHILLPLGCSCHPLPRSVALTRALLAHRRWRQQKPHTLALLLVTKTNRYDAACMPALP